MRSSPWSGYYYVIPPFGRRPNHEFAEPGWKYLAGDACGSLSGGGSYVTLKSTNGKDYSVVVETFERQTTPDCHLPSLSRTVASHIHVWRTSAREQFVRLDDVKRTGDGFTVTLDHNSIYSFSTTTGQQKGEPPIPPEKPFPLALSG